MSTTGERTLPEPTPPSVAPSRYPWAAVLGSFVLVTVVLTVVVELSRRLLPVAHPRPFLPGPSWLHGWFQYDAGWYERIASQGYEYVPGHQSSVAFFPVYPMGVRALGALLGNYLVAGSVLAIVAGAASVLLFGRWAWTRLSRPAAITALAVLMLYPYSLFLYGAVYADSVFLLTAIGAFMLLEKRWYWAAGLVGALATAGRPVGVAVLIGLVVRMLELLADDRAIAGPPGAGAAETVSPSPRRTIHELVGAVRDVRWNQLGVLVSGAGLAGWCVYLWVEFGNPLAFIEVESAPGWDQGVGPRTWFKVAYVDNLLQGKLGSFAMLSVQAVACTCGVLMLRRVWRRFGWGYLAYAVVVMLIPIIGTKDFMGTGRYILVAFPVMAAGGEFLALTPRRWLRPLALGASVALLLLLTSFYGRSIEVS